MSKFKGVSKVDNYQVGYFYEMVNGKEVILDYVVLGESGKVIKSGFKTLDDASSWAEQIFNQELEESARKLADLIDSELQNNDSKPKVIKTEKVRKPRGPKI